MPNLTKITIALLIYLYSLNIRCSSAPDFTYRICSEQNSSYTSNSTYSSNLDLLLTSLSSNATTLNGRKFGNATAGRAPDTVYGIYLCRGDVTDAVCQDCVSTATQEIIDQCPNRKEAISWYEQCMLRYANRSIFSTMEESPRVASTSDLYKEDPDRFNQTVMETMEVLINRAAYNSSGDMFETGEATFIGSLKIYNLVQCTPDISGSDCSKCLESALAMVPNCCSGRQGASILQPSCTLAYNLDPFYGDPAATAQSAPAPSPASPPPGKGRNSSRLLVAIMVPIVVTGMICGFFCCLLTRKMKKTNGGSGDDLKLCLDGSDAQSVDSLRFDLGTLRAVTKDFSDSSKIGEGGFGAVYKGTLSNGREIAVKRLSRNSHQGAEEFTNEVALVAKLQHRNLVRLLGFCLEGEEKILVYEFMPNKSLDFFLFDPEKRAQLDWPRRYKIIGGITRGILYLHEECRLKIIHRDLKASNILLDAKLNPKVSDFGLARIFIMDQSQENTRRIVGTYGYMSPEYAMHGQFSVKSDVFSFGVLVLQIISGKNNSSFYHMDGGGDLLSYAWRHWKNGTVTELIDPTLRRNYPRDEVMRCIHIGLLCVQEDAADRPTMASVVLMLNSYSVTLALPLKPAFFIQTKKDNGAVQSDQFRSVSIPWSVDDGSITEVNPR